MSSTQSLGTMAVYYMKNYMMVPFILNVCDSKIMLFMSFNFYPSGTTLNWAEYHPVSILSTIERCFWT